MLKTARVRQEKPTLKSRDNQRLLSDSHRHAPKQEKRLAKQSGGKLTPGSGSGVEKGDVRVAGVTRIEAKSTQRKSYAISRDLVRRIEQAAVSSDELPIFQIDFLNGADVDSQVAVIPMWALNEFLEKINE